VATNARIIMQKVWQTPHF